MKRIVYLIICMFLSIPVWGQTTQVQQDSTILQIKGLLDKQNAIGRYKVYPTNNTYTSLKLDTATGGIWALQIGIGTTDRMSYRIVGPIEDKPETYIIGRYELYPTNNNYNFILQDTIDGYSYQVQWSTKDTECGRWMIW